MKTIEREKQSSFEKSEFLVKNSDIFFKQIIERKPIFDFLESKNFFKEKF